MKTDIRTSFSQSEQVYIVKTGGQDNNGNERQGGDLTCVYYCTIRRRPRRRYEWITTRFACLRQLCYWFTTWSKIRRKRP